MGSKEDLSKLEIALSGLEKLKKRGIELKLKEITSIVYFNNLFQKLDVTDCKTTEEAVIEGYQKSPESYFQVLLIGALAMGATKTETLARTELRGKMYDKINQGYLYNLKNEEINSFFILINESNIQVKRLESLFERRSGSLEDYLFTPIKPRKVAIA